MINCAALDLMGALDDASVGAIVTDPPFFCSTGRRRESEDLGRHDPWIPASTTLASAVRWTKPHVREMARILRPGGALVFMGGFHSHVAWSWCAERYLSWMNELSVLWNTGKPRQLNFGSLHMHVVWYVKPGARHAMQRTIYSNVVVCSKVPGPERLHQAEKPVGLTNFIISVLTRPGDVVFDPFCGSGSTLVSAAHCDREWLGCDVDEGACKVALRRVQHYELEVPGPVGLWVNGRVEAV